MEAMLSENIKELVFRILNRSVGFCRYDRAALWDMRSKRPKLLGVSGQSAPAKNSELLARWSEIVGALKAPREETVLRPEALPEDKGRTLRALSDSPHRPNILWAPIFARKRLIAGIWVERWNGQAWHEKDIKLLKSLLVSYGAVWDKLERKHPVRNFAKRLGKSRMLLLPAAVMAGMFFVQAPLRVVAPCEVAPKEPVVVTAPIEGVVAKVSVHPGEEVKAGDTLFTYDSRVVMEELKVARQQVEIVQSNKVRVSRQAFWDAEAKAEIEILSLKEKQEQAMLRVAEYKASKLEVLAEESGRVVLDDPNEWRGKPVVVGQKVLMIVDPEKTKLRIWLPADDNINFDPDKPLTVHLNAFPERSLEGRLVYEAGDVSVNPEGVPSVLAEADWTESPEKIKMGLQGCATLYGRNVSLAYWVFRKPWAWIRKVVGA